MALFTNDGKIKEEIPTAPIMAPETVQEEVVQEEVVQEEVVQVRLSHKMGTQLLNLKPLLTKRRP